MVNFPVIGRYECDEVKPSIEMVAKMARAFGVTVDFLIGEGKEAQFLKDSAMLKRFQQIDKLSDEEKECVYSL